MSDSSQEDRDLDVKAPRRGRIALWCAAGLFLAYLAHVVVGKVSVVSGASIAAGFGDVPEFLLLFLACLCFAVAILQLERR
ncbi:MAG: hypothetical protein MI920_07885 [Kiloniellales bacterium]|nr:hypothetical protein [Kiloniellales bacterium]